MGVVCGFGVGVGGFALDQPTTEGVQVASQDAQGQVAFQAQFITVGSLSSLTLRVPSTISELSV